MESGNHQHIVRRQPVGSALPSRPAAEQRKSSRAAAWLDLVQAVSGLLLALFTAVHLGLEASILLGKDAMYFIARLFEGEPLLGKSFPGLVSAIAAIVALLVVVHAVTAIRKMPSSYREYRAFRDHQVRFRHRDTRLWLVQVVTGLILVLVLVHLYQMMMHPGDIGPYVSSDRVWSGRWWPLYLVLLVAVVVHGGVGCYRLAIKWGFAGDPLRRLDRRRLQRAATLLTGFFLLLGLVTIAAYMKLGYDHRHAVGERYHPEAHAEGAGD
jgi:fumarate reductase subunit C